MKSGEKTGYFADKGAARRLPGRFPLFAYLLAFIFALTFTPACFAQTELGSEDDMTVLGVNGDVPDPDLEVKGFSIFGSTNVLTYISTAPGNTVFNGAVQVSSDMYVVGRSTFTDNVYLGENKLYIAGGSNAQLLKKNANGWLEWANDEGGVTGTGLQYRIPMWNTSSALTNSVMSQSATADGITLLNSTLTVQGSAFSVGGSTLVVKDGNVGISTANPQARLDVLGSGSLVTDFTQLWRDNTGVVQASMTATGRLYADGSGLRNIAGDNLGNHVATTTLTTAYAINSSSNITAAYYQIAGSTVLAKLQGTDSLGVGINAGKVNTGNYNLFVGQNAGQANTTGGSNSFLGLEAGLANSTGEKNSFLGAGSGRANSTGSENSFLGYYAGFANSTGKNNSFVGAHAGESNTTGWYNSIVGYNAGFYNQTGAGNSILGYQAGQGPSATSYSSNTIVGYQAAYNLTTGSDNTFLGWQSGYNVTTGTGNIVIGYNKDTSAATANNELNIGGVLYGNLSAKTIGISTRVPQAALDVVSTGTAAGQMAQLWRRGDGVIVGSMSATGVFKAVKLLGDGSELTGLGGSGSGLNADLLDTLDSLDFVRKTGSLSETVTGPKTFTSSATVIVPDTVVSSLWVSTSAITPHLYVSTGGNVGIGTAGPQGRLHVLSNSTTDPYVFATSHTTTGFGLVVSTTGNVGIGTTEPLSNLVIRGINPYLELQDSVANRWGLTIGAGGVNDIFQIIDMAGSAGTVAIPYGNVGIGTTGPGSRFEVVGGSSTFRGSDSNSAIAGFTDAGGNYKLVISTTGNVGIGTTGPEANLQILSQSGDGTLGVWGQQVASSNAILKLRSRVSSANEEAHLSMESDGKFYIKVPSAQNKYGDVTAVTIQNNGNVGIGTAGPAAKLEVKQSASDTYALQISSNDGNYMLRVSSAGNVYVLEDKIYVAGGSTNQVLKKNAGGWLAWGDDQGGVSGTGIQYRIPMWNSDTLLTNSVMNQDGGGDGVTLLNSTLTVQGSAFSVGGSTLAVKDGNVGIGTTTPSSLLHVYNSADAAYTRIQGISDGTNYAGFELWSEEATPRKWQFVHKSVTGRTYDFNIAHYNGASWNTPFAITTAGNVGVGITTPQGLFQVGAGTLTVTAAGNVGVGLTAPDAKLHVQAYETGKYTMYVSTTATAGQYSIAVASTGVTNINNLVIENRTTDPVSPVTGQIWLIVP